jgi:hypothetical protein
MNRLFLMCARHGRNLNGESPKSTLVVGRKLNTLSVTGLLLHSDHRFRRTAEEHIRLDR